MMPEYALSLETVKEKSVLWHHFYLCRKRAAREYIFLTTL